jgi:hypothetical protein
MRRLRIVLVGTAVAFLISAWMGTAIALTFTDVPQNHPYSRAINELAQRGIVSGKDDGTFGPDDPLYRAQFAKMMCGILGLTVSEQTSFAPFVDLGPDDPSDLYPHEFVAAAYGAGVTQGRTATAFAPYSNVTLAQAITMVVRAADARHPGVVGTPPAGWQGRWPAGDPTHGTNIRRAEYAGLLASLPADSLGATPSRPATRGEVSQILVNFLYKTETDDQTDDQHDAEPQLQFKYVAIDKQGPGSIWLKSIGDLNGDGRPDLLAGGHDRGGLVWYRNPSWAKSTIAAQGIFSTDAEVGDVDRDGDNDVVALMRSAVVWFENPTWQSHTIGSKTLHDVELADLDADGDLDVVARNQSEFGSDGDVLHFYRQDTPSSWSYRSLSIASGEGLLLADLDRDGDRDVIVNGSWYENTKDIAKGPWTAHRYTTTWTHRNVYIATADVNHDGRVDIVLSPSELAGGTYRLSWFEAPTDPRGGVWKEHVVKDPVESVLHFVGAADFDMDGTIDIVTAEMQQGADPDEITVYLNTNGDGLAWSPKVVATTGSHSMRVVDVDGDGDMDLYGANWQGNEVQLWLNQIRP